MSKVCKDVGWDGESFYCLRCGKAGFKSEASARGHLSQCKGRAIGRGVPTAIEEGVPASYLASQCPSIDQGGQAPGAGGGSPYSPFSAGGAGGVDGGTTTRNSDFVSGGFGSVPGYVPVEYVQGLQNQINELKATVAFHGNHYNHLLHERNEPKYHPVKGDFLRENKALLVIGLVVLGMIFLSKQPSQCQGTGSGVNMGNVATKALTKMVDTGISKGVSALFK